MIVLGLDPGLGTTGWGVIRAEGSRLSHVAHGRIATDAQRPIAARLAHLAQALAAIIADHRPDEAAIEEIFANRNARSTIKLAEARGALLAVLGRQGLDVGEYAPRLIKQAVVGFGAAEKVQIHAMVARLLPGVEVKGADAADALAVAITHAHMGQRHRMISRATMVSDVSGDGPAPAGRRVA